MIRAKKQIPQWSRARILVADDQAVIRDSVRAILSKNSQWEVCGEALNGKEAVEKVQELKPHLIVLDISMPEMDGFEAAREIRRIAPTTKIVFFTMHEAHQIAVAAREAGADAIVEKTEAAKSLAKAVKRLVERHSR